MSPTHVYICGAKGISQYGGFESFVLNLLQHSNRYKDIKYHIACKANGEGAMNLKTITGETNIENGRFTYCGADCFLIPVYEQMKSAQAIFYDIASLGVVCRHIKENRIENPIVYVLACRVGPFIRNYVNEIHKCGGKLYLNPDGHEWARRKWSKCVRKYWKISERLMVKYSDHIICDSKEIERYIQQDYKKYNPKTSFIPYGADIAPSTLSDDDYRFTDWLKNLGVMPGEYYLVVGRFVEENNFDIIIKEFMGSKTDKKLVLLTTFNTKLKQRLKGKLNYKQDKRITLAEPVYDVELLKKIRENAYTYIHGHEVGGTNPSLLEGLASTKLNLVLGVNFNKEVAGDAALYWEKDEGNLSKLIDDVERIPKDVEAELEHRAKKRMAECYDWDEIAREYATIFHDV